MKEYAYRTLNGFQTQEQDMSSSQSPGQSHEDIAAEFNATSTDCSLSQLGFNGTYEQELQNCSNMVSSSEVSQHSLPLYQNSSATIHPQVVNPYVVAYYNHVFSSYSAPAHITPHNIGSSCTHVLLPPDVREDEPIYVNAKQYHGILKRRMYRAKLESQSKMEKTRKPYLHESRHRHAMKRVRGTGGRFLNTKKLEDSGTSDRHPTDKLDSRSIESEEWIHYRSIDSRTTKLRSSSSEATTSNPCNDDIFRKPDFQYLPFHT